MYKLELLCTFMEEKIQILMIHGGETFNNQNDYLNYLKTKKIRFGKKIRWSEDYLKRELGEDFEITWPRMPLEDNARYDDWKILFDRYIEKLGDNVILIGRSVGGIFLAKYLSENVLPRKIISVYMIAAPFDNTVTGWTLTGGFELGEDLSLIGKNCGKVVLMFSADDDCVPVSHAKKYREKLKDAEIIIYESKNRHFQVGEFPEIVEMIKKDVVLSTKS